MKKALFLSISSVIFFFFLGMFVGIYEFFPYSELAYLKNQFETNSQIMSNNPSKTLNIDYLISIQNESDIFEKRNQLIQFIWNSDDLPSRLPDYVEQNISDERFSDLSNLKQIDKLTIEMESGISSIVYIFLSEIDNNDVILYHQGHSGGFINGKNTIQKLLNSGFTVAAFSMPLTGMNNEPIIEIENIGSVKIFKHNQFVHLERDDFSPMSYFFTPISLTLNYFDKNFSIDKYHMIGISGGGWTTTVYPAIDTRISESFSVAGSLPLSLRNTIEDVGDYEQYHPKFYSIANYLDLYAMSSSGLGREHVQIFNKYDPCCFAGKNLSLYYDSILDSVIQFDSGNFEIIIDDSHKEHKISDQMSELIIEKLT